MRLSNRLMSSFRRPPKGLHLLVATYFEALGDNLATAISLPVEGLHIDLIRAPQQLDEVLAQWPGKRALSLGVVDGRNIWRADLHQGAGTGGKSRGQAGL